MQRRMHPMTMRNHLRIDVGTTGPFAIDLSSRRVRDAVALLDGVRQGQSLGALLGYRFERSLHEAGLDAHIALFRRLAPLAGDGLHPSDAPRETVAANNVVDGWALQRMWQANPTTFTYLHLLRGGVPYEEAKRLERALGALDRVAPPRCPSVPSSPQSP